MHYLALIAVEIPEIKDDVVDADIEEILEELEQVMLEDKEHRLTVEMYAERKNNLRTLFTRTVNRAVISKMQPYWEDTQNPKYLEFQDQTEEILEKYKTSVDCLKLPQGRIVPLCMQPDDNRFVIRDGKVYENNAGPLHQHRRTKRAKRIQALPSYPFQKIYLDLQDFALDWYGLEFNEQEQGYGYYVNPNGMWDWCSIGGRWPYMLLVKESCKEYTIGAISWTRDGQIPETPEGYRWASGARMKDIEWEAMRAWEHERLINRFKKLEQFFKTGVCPKDIYGFRTEKGILYGADYNYYRDESLEHYLKREDQLRERKYPLYAHELLSKDGYWYSQDDYDMHLRFTNKISRVWEDRVNEFLDALSGEDVLVVVDCHR